MLCKNSVLRIFAKFTGKHLYQSLFFNKVAGLRPATLSKKRLWHRCFPLNFAKFLRTPFFTEHTRWLLLFFSLLLPNLYSLRCETKFLIWVVFVIQLYLIWKKRHKYYNCFFYLQLIDLKMLKNKKRRFKKLLFDLL